MSKNKLAIVLLGSVFAGTGAVMYDEFKSDDYSFLDHVDMDEVSGKNLTDEELNERFKRGTDADKARLSTPIVLDYAPCPTEDNPNKECLLRVQEP